VSLRIALPAWPPQACEADCNPRAIKIRAAQRVNAT